MYGNDYPQSINKFRNLAGRPRVREEFEQVLYEDVKVFEPIACYDSCQLDYCLQDRSICKGNPHRWRSSDGVL